MQASCEQNVNVEDVEEQSAQIFVSDNAQCLCCGFNTNTATEKWILKAAQLSQKNWRNFMHQKLCIESAIKRKTFSIDKLL